MELISNTTVLLNILPVDPTEIDLQQCKLLGGFALVVQAILGVIVISVLLLKRAREVPKRKWDTWLGDFSKQICGQGFVHSLNVLISDLIAKHKSSNACSLYGLNILIDTTIGVLILFSFMNLLTRLFSHYSPTPHDYIKGEYGQPFDYRIWVKQALVYLMSLGLMKIVVVGMINIPGVFGLADYILSYLPNDKSQVLFVMLIFPVIMNVFQFYVIDTFLKATTPLNHKHSNSNSNHEYQAFLSDEDDPLSDEESHHHLPNASSYQQSPSIQSKEYKSESPPPPPPKLIARTALERRDTPSIPIASPEIGKGNSDSSYPPPRNGSPTEEKNNGRTRLD